MSDSGIKKAKILKVNLPEIDPILGGYDVRYRIVSEDKNRTSHWSSTYVVVPNFTYTPGTLQFNKNGGIAQLAWDSVEISKNETFVRQAKEYDIWVKWGRNSDGDWIYKQRVEATSVSFPIPTTYTINNVVQPLVPNRLTVEIFLKGNPITRAVSLLRVYQSTAYTV